MPHPAPGVLLLLAVLLFVCGLIVGRLGRVLVPWVRVSLRLGLFVLFTLVVEARLGSVVAPDLDRLDASRRLLEQAVLAGWWLNAAQAAAALTRLVVVLENRPRETRIVSDLAGGAIYVGAALAIVAFVFALPVRGLLATSGVIAIVLGLALQSTLSDVFSGIAVGIERPFKAGDTVALDGDVEGRVEQVNWRSTRVMLDGDTMAVVPNSIIAKTRLLNRSAPTPRRGDHVEVRLHPAVPPERGLAVLRVALQGCNRLLRQPTPSVEIKAIAGDGTTCVVSFHVASGAELGGARSELLASLHRHLAYAGIGLAVPGNVPSSGGLSEPLDAASLLARSDLFGVIGEAHRARLASLLRPLWVKDGEVLFRQGEEPVALFVIRAGVIGVGIGAQDATVSPRHTLGPGETLAAVGLISGKPYIASARALTDAELYRLDKADLVAACETEPGLTEALEAMSRRATAIMARDAAATGDAAIAHPDAFGGRLRLFVRRLRGVEPID